MASKSAGERRRGAGWTKYLWGGAALLLLLPFVAMRFTAEVNWTASDFIIMGAIMALACGAIEVAVRMSSNHSYRLASLIAVGTAFLVVWSNLAVGIVGSEDSLFNMLFFAALALGALVAIVSRLEAAGMARAMALTGGAMVVALAVAEIAPRGADPSSRPVEVIATLVFAALFFLSAALFRRAATEAC